MSKFFIRISILLFIVVALPMLFYFVRQATNLSENEAVVQRVFDEQLETILFTVNQNSENILNVWVNNLDMPVELNGEVMKSITSKLLAENKAILGITFFNLSQKTYQAVYENGTNQAFVKIPDDKLVSRLLNLWKNNYRKLYASSRAEKTDVHFIIDINSTLYLTTLTVDNSVFIQQNLGPFIQQIEQDRFDILIENIQNEQDLLPITNQVDDGNTHRQTLWYLPGYEVSIRLKSSTIEELVSQRSKQDAYVLWGLLIVVLAGFIFIIFNIRKEIRLAEMKSEFVSNVSHEIRTPLALISMYAETLLLKRVKDSKKVDDYLNVIYLETGRLTNMINRILTFSKMEKNKRNFHFAKVDIDETIQGVLQNFEPHFKREKVNCIVDINDKNRAIDADREAVVEVFINLIDNAIKYSKTGEKEIQIRTYPKNDLMYAEIQDNGIGISAKHIHHIFDKFYRVTEGDLALKAKGSGIGLNIVKQIMDKHEGSIEVQSKVNEGTTFILSFKMKK